MSFSRARGRILLLEDQQIRPCVEAVDCAGILEVLEYTDAVLLISFTAIRCQPCVDLSPFFSNSLSVPGSECLDYLKSCTFFVLFSDEKPTFYILIDEKGMYLTVSLVHTLSHLNS